MTSTSTSTSADWPEAAAIVEAVRGFLTDEVMAATTGRTEYLARVAANALGIVERELRAGVEPAMERRDAISVLGYDDEANLAAAIRGGALDDRFDELLSVLSAVTRVRVGIANPRYLDLEET